VDAIKSIETSYHPRRYVRDLAWSTQPHQYATWYYNDADLSGLTHVTKTAVACFAAVRQLRGARRSIPKPAHNSLVVSLVLSRLDHGNATLCGLPDYQCRRLQWVLNAAAKSIFHLQQSDYVTPALIELHWLSAANRVNLNVAT
jgi:hypothetical protein